MTPWLEQSHVMAARRQSHPEDSSVNRFGRADEEAVQRYLDLTDDGEITRLAAIMTPKGTAFDAREQIAQAAALQAEAARELVRRREGMVESMSLATLSHLAGRLGIRELESLSCIHEDSLPDDPIKGPVLRRIVSMMREMPPPQEFADLFLAENPTGSLNRASDRTPLRLPLPDANLEELLRFAANIPEDVVTWDILNAAFIDFLRFWFHDRLAIAELLPDDSNPSQKPPDTPDVMAPIKRIKRETERFHDSFSPGHEFPSDIVELAHRAYTECWEGGILGPQWRRRLGWLADEFTPFWQRFGEAYCAIHQAREKATADAKASLKDAQNKMSAKKRDAGKVGVQRREAEKWRSVTSDFIAYLGQHFDRSSPSELNVYVEGFINSQFLSGGPQLRRNVLEFLSTLCTAVTHGEESRSVLDTLQRSLLVKIGQMKPALRKQRLNKLLPHQRNQYWEKGTIPPTWVQFKSLPEEAVSECLDDLKQALSKAVIKKSKNRLDG